MLTLIIPGTIQMMCPTPECTCDPSPSPDDGCTASLAWSGISVFFIGVCIAGVGI